MNEGDYPLDGLVAHFPRAPHWMDGLSPDTSPVVKPQATGPNRNERNQACF